MRTRGPGCAICAPIWARCARVPQFSSSSSTVGPRRSSNGCWRRSTARRRAARLQAHRLRGHRPGRRNVREARAGNPRRAAALDQDSIRRAAVARCDRAAARRVRRRGSASPLRLRPSLARLSVSGASSAGRRSAAVSARAAGRGAGAVVRARRAPHLGELAVPGAVLWLAPVTVGFAAQGIAVLMPPEPALTLGAAGPAHWLVLNKFPVIERFIAFMTWAVVKKSLRKFSTCLACPSLAARF